MRLYRSIRSAHLERAHDLAPATILYSEKRYDFDDALTTGLDLIRTGPVRGALLLARSRVTTLEINEPLMLDSLMTSVLAIAALAWRRLLGKPRTSVVTYAIDNADPFSRVAGTRFRTRVRRRIERVLARFVWRRVDRVAFGTSAAQETYETVLGEVGLRSSAMVIPALPAPWPASNEQRRIDGRVVFLGAFSERKGIRVLLDAWPLVREARPEASLLIMGKGALKSDVLTTAAIWPGIEVEIDPARGRIHDRLDEARVLVLPSQPTPTWREQVGLPIVEGLSHGLSIVTTEQTGLAEWLVGNKHYVVADAGSADELAKQIIRAIDEQRRPSDIVASLPRTDGRISADGWLFSRVPTISDLTRVFTG
ncbi:glycosyltransferase [Subtercola sp. YIM 133946]|uniref:glycosyltransferase n=1 Tax=Subtercola sp. YIM 133946 TaxID=3118909 RepID=UPI002F94570B